MQLWDLQKRLLESVGRIRTDYLTLWEDNNLEADQQWGTVDCKRNGRSENWNEKGLRALTKVTDRVWNGGPTSSQKSRHKPFGFGEGLCSRSFFFQVLVWDAVCCLPQHKLLSLGWKIRKLNEPQGRGTRNLCLWWTKIAAVSGLSVAHRKRLFQSFSGMVIWLLGWSVVVGWPELTLHADKHERGWDSFFFSRNGWKSSLQKKKKSHFFVYKQIYNVLRNFFRCGKRKIKTQWQKPSFEIKWSCTFTSHFEATRSDFSPSFLCFYFLCGCFFFR